MINKGLVKKSYHYIFVIVDNFSRYMYCFPLENKQPRTLTTAFMAFPKIDTYTNERGEVKKKPIGMPNWRTINKQNCLYFNTGSAYAVVTGEMSNLTIFDFDSKVDYERLIEKHPDLKNYKTIKTNKGFHIWFTYDPDY